MELSKQKKILEINRRTDITDEEKQKLINNIVLPKIIKEENTDIKCNHYTTNCSIMCNICFKFYKCRICHDENEHHKINRYTIKNMKCELCGSIQECSNKCINCNKEMAEYYCNICHLFDSYKGRTLNHCEKCNICRIGKNKHCDACNMCFNESNFDNHICVPKNRYEDNCSICNEELKNSRYPNRPLKCSHVAHNKCFEKYINSGNYQCPICRKSIINMELHWNLIDNYMKNIVTPPEIYGYKVNIFCNDCQAKSVTDYHYVYNKCINCNSWNTDILEILK